MAKGTDSDTSEVETTYVLSPHSEQAYQKVNQDFHAAFEGKSVSCGLFLTYYSLE